MSSPTARLVGARIKRKEDLRILTGKGRYIDDVHERGQLSAYFVRSVVPHGRITRIDAEAARAMPGVAAVYTGADMAAMTNPVNLLPPMPGLVGPTFPVLAVDTVRLVGDPVALVIATDRYLAEDAGAMVDIDYDVLDPVVSCDDAFAEGAPQLFEDVPGNLIFTDEATFGDIDEAFAQADRIVTDVLDQHRWSCVPMEGRGGIATYDSSTGALTYEASTQSTHLLRIMLAGFTNQPINQLRVVANDIGGAFGLKFTVCREDIAVCAAAKKLGAAVKWTEDRHENLTSSGSAREEKLTLEAAVRDDGTLLGLRVTMAMNLGAYPGMASAFAIPKQILFMLPGPYKVPAYSYAVKVAATNKSSYVALRGPWAVETLVRERLMDKIADELGMSPVDLRRKNLITLADQPYPMGAGFPIESVTAAETFERLVTKFDPAAIRAEQEAARAEGRLLGFGMATAFEPAPGTAAYWANIGFPMAAEPMRVRIEADGDVTAFTAQVPHGQGHETTLAQVIADEMGVGFDDVRVVFGDTDATPYSMMGTAGSKAAMMATGAATVATREVKAKVLEIAAHMLEASPADLQIEGSVVSVKGVPSSGVPLAQIAMGAMLAPGLMPPGVDLKLQADTEYDGETGGWSSGSHACWVEIDPDTGKIEIKRYLVVEDCGTMINPGVVDGQVFGAVAMGLGGMLLEHSAYGPDGQYVAATFMDYLMPSAPEVPEIEIDHLEYQAPTMIGPRGVGEGGTVIAPAALMNAIDDALRQVGGTRIEATPVTPTRILEAMGVIPRE
jgi:carbon-monoxide dehydrogenase large subunit